MTPLLLAAALLLAAPLCQAQAFTTLALPTRDADIRGWTGGGDYAPLFATPPATVAFNGVPFVLDVDAQGHNVFHLGSTDIAVGVFGVTQAWTLINSAWGVAGQEVGSVEFFGSGGAYHRVALVEGLNVRDHYADGFNNTIDHTSAVPAYGLGGVRLDQQVYTLPAAFAGQTLLTLRFNNTGGNPQGSPFIAAATVSAVPEPAAWLLALAGAGGLAAWRRRRRG